VRPIERVAQNLYLAARDLPGSGGRRIRRHRGTRSDQRRLCAESRVAARRAAPCRLHDDPACADGAFYLYADVSRFTPDSEAFAKAMLREIGVAVTPGTDFDPVHGRNYVRFSYAGPEPAMREAARRIKDWMK
jgi:aspartate/methionine/tyrosine aminotransferase